MCCERPVYDGEGVEILEGGDDFCGVEERRGRGKLAGAGKQFETGDQNIEVRKQFETRDYNIEVRRDVT